MAKSITQSVGKQGANRPGDVKIVQELINNNIGKITPLRPLGVDGRVGRLTTGAIEEFQRRVVRMGRPDGRVDPGGRTWTALNQNSKPSGAGKMFRVVFQHHGKTPEDTSSTKGTDGLYESTVTVAGRSFRGSIYPDDMSVKGRLKDGTYDLYLGFHKRKGHTPKAADLVARSDGFRAALIVNADQSVPVISNNSGKTTSSLVHVHNGYNSKRYSDGCPTIRKSDWSRFIQVFLNAYPALADWKSRSTFIGKKIGTLEIKA